MQDRGILLYRRFLDGDEGGLEQLIALYQRGLLRFIYSYVHDSALAEDIMQEVFIQLYFKRSFQPRDDASFKTYLYKIARNKSLNELKKRKRKKEISLEKLQEKNKEPTKANKTLTPSVLSPLSPEFFYGENLEETLEKEQRAHVLQSALDEINEEYRETLILRYFDGLPIETIAKITNKKVKQVYNLLSRGKVALKETLIKRGYDYENF